jgi:DNA-binding GntR family transcriptional regulator
MRRLAQQGRSLRQIERQLGFSRETVRRAICNDR